MIFLFIFSIGIFDRIHRVHLQAFISNLDELRHAAAFGGAEDRGHLWYDTTSSSGEEISDYRDENQESSSLTEDKDSSRSFLSDQASSQMTKEKFRRLYRTCSPCPGDMLKKFGNHGIQWICGRYQKAFRSFKSECMMRYRNCEDGTMFVKVTDYPCKDNPEHGKHWFYDYKA